MTNTLSIDEMTNIIDTFDGYNPETGVSLILPPEAYAVYADNINYSSATPEEFVSNFDEWASDAEDSFQGSYDSDEDFAYELAEQLGDLSHDVQWPYTCIDWEQAARELMYDYWSNRGYYFRNI